MTTLNQTFRLGGEREINRLGFGAMRLTGQPGNFGPYSRWEQGKALLRRAADLGVNFFDSARAYGPEWADQLIADALAPYADNALVATKGGVDKLGPQQIVVDGRPATLERHIRCGKAPRCLPGSRSPGCSSARPTSSSFPARRPWNISRTTSGRGT